MVVFLYRMNYKDIMKEAATWQVIGFLDKDGNNCSDIQEQTIMMATVDGSMTHPFPIRIARELKLDIGDTFEEVISYSKKETPTDYHNKELIDTIADNTSIYFSLPQLKEVLGEEFDEAYSGFKYWQHDTLFHEQLADKIGKRLINKEWPRYGSSLIYKEQFYKDIATKLNELKINHDH